MHDPFLEVGAHYEKNYCSRVHHTGWRHTGAGRRKRRYRRWTIPYWHDDIGNHFFEAISQADALLLGRKTWQIHGEAFEPMTSGDPFADVMNGIQKIVVSTSLESAAAWRNSSMINSNVAEEVRRLKDAPGKNILMDGSSVLIHTLAQHDLVDEYTLHVYPVVLGSGKRLFPEGKRINLELMESRTLPTGVVFPALSTRKHVNKPGDDLCLAGHAPEFARISPTSKKRVKGRKMNDIRMIISPTHQPQFSSRVDGEVLNWFQRSYDESR
jgi:dihydrofolate reductase